MTTDPADSIALLQALAPREGYTLTGLPDVRLLRSDRPMRDTPVLYDPGIVIVCQGAKRGYFGDEVYVYDERQYLAVSVPVPFTMQTDASHDRPLLAIYLHLDFKVVAELMLELDRAGGHPVVAAPRSMVSSPFDADMQASVHRLLQTLSRPLETAVLGPASVREVYFRVLTGPQGQALLAALSLKGHFSRIGKALQRIHGGYAGPLDLPLLAREAGMSVARFHSQFKAITQTSPMQYVKSTRLHQARLLMVRESMTAAAACHAVGYESTSQFSREFKRLFGRAPAAEARRMKAEFAVPPAHAGARYVSSH